MKSNLKEVIDRYKEYLISFDTLSKRVKFPDLMYENGKCVPVRSLGLDFSEIVKPYAEIITNSFDTSANSITTHLYDNKPLRIKFTNLELVEELTTYFANLFDAELTETTITRNCVTELTNVTKDNFDSKQHWYSDFWHTDNFIDGNFKIMIYLTDVMDSGSSPFEYVINPTDYFYKHFDSTKIPTRFYDLKPSKKETIQVFAPKYTTLIFSPSFIHKGNYARTTHRDSIMLGFNQR